MNKPKIIFIAPQLQQPRVIKRINTVYKAGYDIKVYGFDSGIFSKNLKSISFPVTEIIKRDKKDSKLKKVLLFAKTLLRIRRENSKDDIFYIFSAELGNLSILLKGRKTIYEEADIMGAYFKNPYVRALFKKIDIGTIKRSLLTVFTSAGFVDYTFGNNKPQNILVIPNKLNSGYFNNEIRSKIHKKEIDLNHLKFGFVGIIRYPNTIVRFAEVVAREFPQHEFHFFGDPDVLSYVDKVKNASNVTLHGPFVNPTDLSSIYQNIDIVISCYDITNWNVRVAEPNKLYEAVFFNTPIVVSKGTFLEKQVSTYGVGFAIKADNDSCISEFINHINSVDIMNIKLNMEKIPCSELIDNTEPFLCAIQQIISSSNT